MAAIGQRFGLFLGVVYLEFATLAHLLDENHGPFALLAEHSIELGLQRSISIVWRDSSRLPSLVFLAEAVHDRRTSRKSGQSSWWNCGYWHSGGICQVSGCQIFRANWTGSFRPLPPKDPASIYRRSLT